MSEQFGEFIARLTDNARTSLQHAETIARGQGSPYIGTEHMLLGVLAQGSSVGAKLLADIGVTLQRAELALNLSPKTIVIGGQTTRLSETAVLTLKMAHDYAKELHQEFLGTEHILYAIVKQQSARGTVLLRDMQTDIEHLTEELENFFDRQQSDYEEMTLEADVKPPRNRNSILDAYGADLTQRARQGKLDAVIGRDAEEERVVTILSRRTKNNPVLLGEPGVGKTAIVEGLAQRIVREDVPGHLLDKRIVQLDLASMVAGTKYRGEFEDRLKKVIAEVKKQGNVVLFIDELHLLVGAGSAEGAMDAANILKPALARGEIHMIGATTLDEYRKHIEKDSALERRFQTVIVREPSLRDTIAIVKGLRGYYESHHNVRLTDDILETAVHMAQRYITDRFMPDKAIDVIDEASALVRVEGGKKPSRLRDYTRQLRQLSESMEEAGAAQDYERAALYKTRISRLQEKVANLRDAQHDRQPTELTEAHVARAIATMTGVPVEKVQRSELRMLKQLERHLSRSIIGQQEAIKQVARAIRRSRSGIASGTRPIGSFVFMGPTGVGKTELARVIAHEVFGRDDALIKIDMSEFGEKHTSARLVGAPAGYVGYEDGGKLTDKVRRQPYSVVLFDEIEKAHPDVFSMLLQLLEDGVLTDTKGRSVSFTNTIIILTSNLGSDSMMNASKLGFRAASASDHAKLEEVHQENAEAALDALKKFMRPELINRFDSVVTFRPLTRREMRRIGDKLIAELADRLAKQGFGLRLTPRAKRWVLDRGFDERQGARPLRRVIEDQVEHAIAEHILDDKFQKGDIITVDVKDKQIAVEAVRETDIVGR
ncbi:ATP-dependent Clp protease ATP-binding protein ClpC [Candidatus Saccharibacteria bacterium]|nr:MAG: ATP-dependent Clp protease ATP-binding protein ClpC [Candidatus Saccharibacteria bacterium]